MIRECSFTVVEKDLIQGTRLHAFSSYRQTSTMVKLILLWAVATACMLLISYSEWRTWPERLSDIAPIALVFAAVIIGVIFGVPLLVAPRVIRTRFKQERLLNEPATASWDEEVYAIRTPSAQSRLAWTDYAFLRENDRVFAFATSNFAFQVLPKRALTSEQIEDIHRIIQTHR